MTRAFEPTQKQRESVEFAAAMGMPHERIAALISISADTLVKHFKVELDGGLDKANSQVVQSAFKMAISGKVPAATFFWLKCRAGWRERHADSAASDPVIRIIGGLPDPTGGADGGGSPPPAIPFPPAEAIPADDRDP